MSTSLCKLQQPLPTRYCTKIDDYATYGVHRLSPITKCCLCNLPTPNFVMGKYYLPTLHFLYNLTIVGYFHLFRSTLPRKKSRNEGDPSTDDNHHRRPAYTSAHASKQAARQQ